MRNASVLAALLIAGLLAPAAVRAADLKIGYVHLRRAAYEVDEGKAVQAQLKKDGQEKQKQLDEKAAELKKLDAEFKKQSIVLSDKAKAEKAAEFQQKFMEADQLRSQMERDLAQREQRQMVAIIEKMEPIVKEIAEADGLTYVLDRTVVVYGPEAQDLTNELVRKYNARFGKKGAAAAPAAAPKK